MRTSGHSLVSADRVDLSSWMRCAVPTGATTIAQEGTTTDRCPVAGLTVGILRTLNHDQQLPAEGLTAKEILYDPSVLQRFPPGSLLICVCAFVVLAVL